MRREAAATGHARISRYERAPRPGLASAYRAPAASLVERNSTPGRAPSVEGAPEAVPATLALTRLARGTWEKLLSAASSRT